jgi:hypothetical protein
MSVRCSAASIERGDELAGTATAVGAFLLVEAPGPWGEVALRDARLPDPVKAHLRGQAARTRVRVLLIRRVGRTEAGATRVFAVRAGEWVESTLLDDVSEVSALDLEALGAGRSPGLPPWSQRVVLVCTHGRHDACCAERGRPLVSMLAAAVPEQVWECSHLGGDRFAGNVLVLPDGLGFGRVDPGRGPGLLADLDRGILDLDLMRGRSTLRMPAQYAELALRRHLGEAGVDAVRHLGDRRSGDAWVATFVVSTTTYDVTVRTHLGEPAPLTCRAWGAQPVPRHEVTAITPLGPLAYS